MQIITVAPVVKGALQGSLTYFSKDPIAVGMVVTAPLRSREIPAIVLESRNASDAKSSLKTSDYTIKKITRARPRRIWVPTFLAGVQETATVTAQKFGEVLMALTPKTILDAHLAGDIPEIKESQQKGLFEIHAIQASTKLRYEAYQRLIRESFVRRESIFICVPTEEDVARLSIELGRGIEDYTFSLHSGLTKKRILEKWTAITESTHAILAIGTPQYLSLPHYFKTIILDEENSHVWKMIARPFLDLRLFAETYARENGSTLILGASILRSETQYRIEKEEISEFNRISLHAREEIQTTLIDPRKEEKTIRENTGRRTLAVITSPLREIIERSISQNEQILLISARKGLTPITVCGDCGTFIRCPQCETPLVVHKKEAIKEVTQIFICHGCGFMRIPEDTVHETCPTCGGWKLQGMGIGIDRIDAEIANLFPKVQRFILDGERAKTRTQAKKILAQFEKTPGGILIATPMVIPLLKNVPVTAIVSIDSLFAIPDIRMPERIFALVLALREKTTKTLIVQTRTDDTNLFTQALEGNLSEFIKNELTIRKTFSYPPYGTIIKITVRGKRTDVTEEIDQLKNFLEGFSPIIPGSIAREPKNVFRMHLIIKLAEGSWPHLELLGKLRALPHQFSVEINPDHLL